MRKNAWTGTRIQRVFLTDSVESGRLSKLDVDRRKRGKSGAAFTLLVRAAFLIQVVVGVMMGRGLEKASVSVAELDIGVQKLILVSTIGGTSLNVQVSFSIQK